MPHKVKRCHAPPPKLSMCLRHKRHVIVFADALKHQECCGTIARISYKMGPLWRDGIRVTGTKQHFLLRLTKEQPQLYHLERRRSEGPPAMLVFAASSPRSSIIRNEGAKLVFRRALRTVSLCRPTNNMKSCSA